MKLLLSDSFPGTATRNYDFVSDGQSGQFQVDITGVTGSISAVISIYGVNPHNGTEWLILASAAKTATGQTLLKVHNNLTASANLIAKDVLSNVYRVKIALTAAAGTMAVKVYGWTN
jgi:hypothetical protein